MSVELAAVFIRDPGDESITKVHISADIDDVPRWVVIEDWPQNHSIMVDLTDLLEALRMLGVPDPEKESEE